MARKITALKLQKKNTQRVNVYLDGEFAFGLARIVAAWLQVGQELSEEKIAELRSGDEREVALQRALHFISFRPRTEREVRQNLEKAGLPPDVIEETLVRLQEQRLIDDSRFAEFWIDNRTTFRPRSERLLALELRQRGLTEPVIEEAIQTAAIDEQAAAYQAAQKRSRRLAGLDRLAFRQKLGSFLARRGFNYETITGVVNQLWEELQETDSGRQFNNDNEETL